MSQSTQSPLCVSAPTLFLIIFLLIANTANGLYFGFAIVPSPAFNLVYSVCFFWIIGWWLMEDSRKYEMKWMSAWGIFLYIAAWFVIPFHLFRTRGLKAFLPLLSFIGFFVGTYVTGISAGVVMRLLIGR